ncbi:MAG: cytochrome c [Vicinamibacterales bacterium]
MLTRIVMRALLLGALLAGASAVPAVAQTADGSFSSPSRFVPRDGATLYRTSCQACHMAAGEGAIGAGIYPALAKNVKLRTARYPLFVVTNGQKGMPPFGPMMDDEQIAAVVNFIRGNLGNDYTDAVSAADVKALRK